MYERVSRWLNLKAMRELFEALISASEHRLLYVLPTSTTVTSHYIDDRCVLLRRLSRVIIDMASTARPLIHLMNIWPICTLHLIQAFILNANHKFFISDCMFARFRTDTNGCRMYSRLCCRSTHRRNIGLLFQSDTIHTITKDTLFGYVRWGDTRADGIDCCRLCNIAFGTDRLRMETNVRCIESDTHIARIRYVFHRFLYYWFLFIDDTILPVRSTVLNIFAIYIRVGNRDVFMRTALECINCLLHYLQANGLW